MNLDKDAMSFYFSYSLVIVLLLIGLYKMLEWLYKLIFC